MAEIRRSRPSTVSVRITAPTRRWAAPAWTPYALLALVAAAVYGQAFYGRGLDVPDEGLLLHVAERLAQGQVPYRDVYFIYTPGWQYLLAGVFRLFGPSLAVEHALLFTVHVALVLVVYGLAARLAWRPLAMAAALVVIASGVSPYRTLMGLVTVAALTRYADTAPVRWLCATGLLVGASYLVGQEIGVYTLGAALGYLAVDWLLRARWLDGSSRRASFVATVRQAALLIAGTAIVILPWLAIIAAQGALPAMLDDTLRVTFLHQPRYMHVALPTLWPLVPDDLSPNVVWGPRAYLLYVKLMLYLPLLTVAAATGVVGARMLRIWGHARTEQEAGRIAAGLLGAVALRGGELAAVRRVLPLALFAALALGTLGFRADYYHLRQMLPVTLILLAWLLSELRLAILDLGWSRWAAVAVLAPFAVMLAVNAGEAAVQRQQLAVPLETARGTVLVDGTTARDLGGLLHALDERTGPGDAIYVAPAETAIYFLADRRDPTRFGQLVPTETEVLREYDGARQRELIAAVDGAGVRWVVTANLDNVDGVPFATYAPLIARYLDERFEPEARYGYWTLQRRR